MKRVVCNRFGPPEDLVVEEVDAPAPQAGQAIVEVRAVPVTFPDLLMLEDKYQFKAPPPYVPGGEVAGVVTAVADDVTEVSVGDRVVSATASGTVGGFAELAAVTAANALVLPDEVGFAESTGLGYGYGTTYHALVHRAELQAGETMLVLGAGGHLGVTAIELGKLFGATVIAAASTDAKLDLCRTAGADMTINYSTEDLKARAKELTDGNGVDVIYDPVGGDYAETALRASAWGGRHLVIGFTAGIPKLALNLTLLKGCSVVGVFYGAWRMRDPEGHDQMMEELVGYIAQGRLRPHVAERYRLDEAGAAMRRMLDRQAAGKIVLEPVS